MKENEEKRRSSNLYEILEKIDDVKNTNAIDDAKKILDIFEKDQKKEKRGISTREIEENLEKIGISRSRSRPLLMVLLTHEIIKISEKIGNTIFYDITPKGKVFITELKK